MYEYSVFGNLGSGTKTLTFKKNIGPILFLIYAPVSGRQMGLYCAIITSAIFNLFKIVDPNNITVSANNGLIMTISNASNGSIEYLILHARRKVKNGSIIA